MLKTTETYIVTIVLNDENAMVCTLLSKPDAVTLAAVATAQKVSAELIEAAAFVRDLVTPAVGEDRIRTPITVAGTEIGLVQVETELAYVWPTRKPRKPKDETDKPKRKRGRKPKNTEPVPTVLDNGSYGPDRLVETDG